MTIIDPQTGRPPESLEAENARLRARLAELERERSSDRSRDEYEDKAPRSARRRDETEDSVRDIPSHAADTLDRLARGFAYAMVEQMQSGVDALNAVADEIFGSSRRRRRTRFEETDRETVDTSRRRTSVRSEEPDRSAEYDDEPERRAGDQVVGVMSDVAYGLAEGLHQALDAPRRAVDRFYEAYREEDEPGRERSASRRHETAGERGTRVRKEKTEESVSPRGSKVKSEIVTERKP